MVIMMVRDLYAYENSHGVIMRVLPDTMQAAAT